MLVKRARKPGPGLTARSELVSYRDRGWPEDYDLVLRIWEGGGRFRNVDRLVHRWRDHPQRLTRTEPVLSVQPQRENPQVVLVGCGRQP